jgi:hypothetical protein
MTADTTNTPRGPFETEAQAAAAAEPMFARIRRADPGRGAMTDQVRAARLGAKVAYVTDTLTAAGVELGQHDEHIARWIAHMWDPETTVVVLDWVLRAHAAASTGPARVERARYEWVLYRPHTGAGVLERSGTEGRAVGIVDPVQLATQMLTKHATGDHESVVKVFGGDGWLRAWAQWENGEAVVYLPQDGGTR